MVVGGRWESNEERRWAEAGRALPDVAEGTAPAGGLWGSGNLASAQIHHQGAGEHQPFLRKFPKHTEVRVAIAIWTTSQDTGEKLDGKVLRKNKNVIIRGTRRKACVDENRRSSRWPNGG